MSKFGKYGGKVSFTIGDEEISFKRIKTEKLQALINYTKDEETVLTNIVEFFVDLMKNNYPEEKEEDIYSFVQQNAMEIFEEFQIASGLVKRKELEKAKAKALNKEDGTKNTEIE